MSSKEREKFIIYKLLITIYLSFFYLLVILKMKERYNTGYNEATEKQATLECVCAENKLSKQIENTMKSIESDDYISVCRRDVYHNNIEVR